ncbi:hypothetical protein Ancab_038804 [Ancistrocladus abbreviatus]
MDLPMSIVDGCYYIALYGVDSNVYGRSWKCDQLGKHVLNVAMKIRNHAPYMVQKHHAPHRGDVAQMVERSLSMREFVLQVEVLDMWRMANAVCFDVDSTVCIDEGIDELAEFCGAGKAVAERTSRAMDGSVTFQEALTTRLSLINPSLAQLQDYLEKRPPRISPGIAELVRKLKVKSTEVYLVSGGFHQMINPVASLLEIPFKNIFANRLLLGNSGEFLGFDKNEPTSRSGGKPVVVQQIKKVGVAAMLT